MVLCRVHAGGRTGIGRACGDVSLAAFLPGTLTPGSGDGRSPRRPRCGS